MLVRTLCFTVVVFILCAPTTGFSETPVNVTLCQLKSDPPTFNQKIVEVTAFVSQGFEDFTLFDPGCPAWPAVWVEYGGMASSGTIYCCGGNSDRKRPKTLEMEGIPTALVEDDRFQTFDELIHRRTRESAVAHATLIGRFFAGRLESYGNSPPEWRGYGHMGCCSLFVLQQVSDVDSQKRDDLDYDQFASSPFERSKRGCGFSGLTPLDTTAESLRRQKEADQYPQSWAFDQPDRLASESLTRLAKLSTQPDLNLDTKYSTIVRKVYIWKPSNHRATYTVIVSRPYWLSFYAKDPKRVAWVLLAVFRSSCDSGNSVTRIR
jgi:hypothetical protein